MLGAMGSFAVVAGDISPRDALAPRETRPPVVYPEPALMMEPAPAPEIDPALIPARPVVPSGDFIAGQLAALPTPVPGTRLSESTLLAYASLAGWPEHLHDELLVVARCESRNRPYATNGVVRGLMQLDPLWFSYTGIAIDDWADPLTNLRVAYGAYQYDIGRGHTAWTQWQCKPDGTVSAAPPTPDSSLAEAASSGSAEASANPSRDETTDASAEATPASTPAPWDNKPAWPPQSSDADTPVANEAEPESEDPEEPTAEPTATPSP